MSSDTGDRSPLNDDALRAAFDRFVNEYGSRLRPLVARSLGRFGGELDDVLQSTYEVLWERRSDVLPDPRRAFAFCRAVAENLARKHAGREPRAERVAEFAEDARGFQPDPADLLIAAERGQVAMSVFGALNARQQQVWWLCDVEDLPHRDVARIVGSTVPGVAVQLARARKALRRHGTRLRALLAGPVLPLPPMRHARPEPAALAVPSYVLASFAMLVVVGGHGAVRPTWSRPDHVAGPAANVPDPRQQLIRDVPGDRPPARRAAARQDRDDNHPPGKKVSGCVADEACVNQSQPGVGHTLWVARPAVPGVAGAYRYEVWQRRVPTCDAVGPLPDNDYVGCDRYGETSIESRYRHEKPRDGRRAYGSVEPGDSP